MSQLGAILDAAGFLIALQFMTRILNFMLNQFLLRYTEPEALGTATVQLDLLATSLLFLSREAVRAVLLRLNFLSMDDIKEDQTEAKDEKEKRAEALEPIAGEADRHLAQLAESRETRAMMTRFQFAMNLSWLPVCLGGCLFSLGLCWVQYHNQSTRAVPLLALLLYSGASMLELCVEPLCILAQNLLFFRERVWIEGAAISVYVCVATLWTLYCSYVVNGDGGMLSDHQSIMIFAYAQWIYGMVMAGGYIILFHKKIQANQEHDQEHQKGKKGKWRRFWQILWRIEHRSATAQTSAATKAQERRVVFLQRWADIFPRRVVTEDGHLQWFDMDMLRLSMSFMGQSIVKWFLSEGDKLIMTIFSSSYEQGVYALVFNYGSMLVRIVFLPFEEVARAFFTKTLVTKEGDCAPQSGQLRSCLNALCLVIKFHLYLGLLFICFGTQYSQFFIDIMAGKKWSESTAGSALAVYAILIPFLGINGITEAFVHSVAPQSFINRTTSVMVVFFAVYSTVAFVLMNQWQLGAAGVIVASMVNMFLRILWSFLFIHTYFTGLHKIPIDFWKMVPSWKSVAAFTVSAICIFAYHSTMTAQGGRWEQLQYFGVGSVFGLSCLAVFWLSEKEFIRQLQKLRRGDLKAE